MSQLHTLRYNPSGKPRYWHPFIPSLTVMFLIHMFKSRLKSREIRSQLHNEHSY